jgi:DNA (cytosine-5)-methyltransferase 1
MKILNLYACLGGNRFKWEEINPDIKVTAVELDPDLCELYKMRFPNDQVICADAHQFLLDHYQEFEFIWSSPPCPTHSRARFWGIGKNGKNPVYPDLTLYQEIIFLQSHFNGKFCVENVIPYYDPLIPGQKRGRHIYWTNFKLPANINERKFLGLCQRTKNNAYQGNEFDDLCEYHKFDFNCYNGSQNKIKIARNLVDYEAGKTIFSIALNILEKKETKQTNIIFEI